jgi:hypothetical protein
MSIRKDASGKIISIDLFDGDTGDMDRTPDGSVSHIGGISIDFPIHEDLGSIDCFIRSSKNVKKKSSRRYNYQCISPFRP